MPVVPGRPTERIHVSTKTTCRVWYITLRDRVTAQVGNSSVHHKARVIRIRRPAYAIDRRYSELRVKHAVVIKIQIIPLKHVARIGRRDQDKRLGSDSHRDTVCGHDRSPRGIRPTRTIETLAIDNRDRSVGTESRVAKVCDVTDNSKLTWVTVDRQEERTRWKLRAGSADDFDVFAPFSNPARRINFDLIQERRRRRRRHRRRT